MDGQQCNGLSLDARGYAGTNTTFNGANLSGSMTVNSGGVQVSLSGAGGGTTNQTGPNIGVSNLGNTAGSTGTVSTGDVVFVGSQGISLSQSTGAAGSAATITIRGRPEMSFFRQAGQITAAGTAQANSLVSIQPFLLAEDLICSNLLLAGSFNVASAANNSSAYIDMSVSAVVYSRNGSTLNSVTSFGSQYTTTWSSNATGSVTGVLGFSATGNNVTLTAGEYYLAVHISTANSATGGAATTALGNTCNMILSGSIGSAANLVKCWGAQTNASQGLIGGQGVLSTNATRATLAFSDYVQTGTRAFLAPVFFELRNATFQI